MHKKIVWIAEGAIIAALYIVLTCNKAIKKYLDSLEIDIQVANRPKEVTEDD